MLNAFLILLGLVPIILVIAFVSLLYWLSADFPDERAEVDRTRRSQSLFKRMFRWLNRPTERLDYRRDKLGRFRKVRRG